MRLYWLGEVSVYELVLVRKGYLEAGRADDSLDLELGASASGVQGRKMLENSSRRGSGKFIVIVFGIHTEHPKN